MLDHPEQYCFNGLRRNAIKPGEIEHLIKNRNGPLHPPWATSPMRKRKCSTINHHKALKSRPEARVQVTQLYDMGLPVLSHDDATAMKTSRHRGTTYLESQPEHPTKVRPAKKRKRASLSEEDEYDDVISSSLDDFHPKFDEAGTVLTNCNDGTYCCGARNFECCDRGSGYKINPKNGQIVIQSRSSSSSSSSTTSSSSSSSTSTSASTTATSSTPTTTPNSQPASTSPPTLPSPTPSSSTGLSSGAKAGIAIGAIVGILLIAALAFLLFRERRKRSRALKAQQQQHTMGMGGGGYNDAWQSVPSQGSSHEMQMHQQPQHQQQQRGTPVAEMGAYERNEGKYHYRGEMGDAQGKPAELI
ncbi:MAG: hypothetical protein Q9186_005009 [Xanthomendoza sp. 1 TL-2023]